MTAAKRRTRARKVTADSHAILASAQALVSLLASWHPTEYAFQLASQALAGVQGTWDAQSDPSRPTEGE